MNIAGDLPATTPGNFRGFADAGISRDPLTGKFWLAYSWPHIIQGKDPEGKTVYMAAVSTHLANSDDGKNFTFVREVWPSVPAVDPEKSGETGIISSETPSIVPMQSGGTITWYSARLRYFLEPRTGYHPKYATSWTVRIGAASSPDRLADAEEVTLGVSQTSSAYNPAVQLDKLAGLPVTRCAMLNNPTLFAEDGTLYLIVECLAFRGTTLDVAHSTLQEFYTTPVGDPSSWVWKHAGVLADASLARQLGQDTIQQPDVSLASDGTPILIITPAHEDPANPVGTTGDGCVALELASLNPPELKRDCNGNAVVRARINGQYIACTHTPSSATGIIAGHVENNNAGPWTLHASGLRP